MYKIATVLVLGLGFGLTSAATLGGCVAPTKFSITLGEGFPSGGTNVVMWYGSSSADGTTQWDGRSPGDKITFTASGDATVLFTNGDEITWRYHVTCRGDMDVEQETCVLNFPGDFEDTDSADTGGAGPLSCAYALCEYEG